MNDNSIEGRIRRELPHLAENEVRELARAVDRLVASLSPERIYVFGSRARGVAAPDSDIDLMVVVPSSDAPPYLLAQAAYRAVGEHTVSLDILVMNREEFESRRHAPASLPATILREGRMLYAA